MNKRWLKAGLAGLAGALAGVAATLIHHERVTPEERERRRRRLVYLHGRPGNAIITEVRDGVIGYTYRVGRIEYTAFQDVRALEALLPADPATLIQRPATLKYLPGNPANSILLCEQWSGLQFQPQATGS